MIGKKIFDLRKGRNISQSELAKKAGLANSTLCDIEKDRLTPSLKTLNKLANALEVEVAIFFLANNSVDNVNEFQSPPRATGTG